MKLYKNYLLMSIRSQMQYRASFIMIVIGQLIHPVINFIGVFFLMMRFGELGGWTIEEISFSFGSLMISYAVAEAFARGFDTFSGIVRNGTFDRILVRPRGTVVQILGSRFEMNRVGKLLSSIAIYVWATIRLDTLWGFDKLVVAAGMILAGVFVFSGIFILYATLCFWTIEGTEIMHILTDGSRELARIPLNIYDSKIIRFFIFIVPIASANFLPLMYITDRVSENAWIYAISPVLGFLFIIPCMLLWRFGVRHYKSTGS